MRMREQGRAAPANSAMPGSYVFILLAFEWHCRMSGKTLNLPRPCQMSARTVTPTTLSWASEWPCQMSGKRSKIRIGMSTPGSGRLTHELCCGAREWRASRPCCSLRTTSSRCGARCQPPALRAPIVDWDKAELCKLQAASAVSGVGGKRSRCARLGCATGQSGDPATRLHVSCTAPAQLRPSCKPAARLQSSCAPAASQLQGCSQAAAQLQACKLAIESGWTSPWGSYQPKYDNLSEQLWSLVAHQTSPGRSRVDGSFLEYVNSLLSGGEIPGLFTSEELAKELMPLEQVRGGGVWAHASGGMEANQIPAPLSAVALGAAMA
eukprot:364232-Chlamydomonas_euryale.AAC.11